MTRFSLAAALVAAIVVVVGGALLLQPRFSSNVGPPASTTPSPSESPHASSSAPAAVTPVELQHAWLGKVVDAPGLPSGRDRSILRFGPSTVEKLEAVSSGYLTTEVANASAGVLRLVAPEKTEYCEAGDVGLYNWSLSPKGSLLQLTATAEDCTARKAAFAGEWERAACLNPDNLCLGDLEAGTYRSQFIGPRLDEGEPWTANFGALSYTVPDGWSNTWDFPDSYVLMRSDDYAAGSDPRDGSKDLIEVITRPAAALQDATCDPAVKSGVGRSVDELIDYVTHHRDITAGKPQPIRIDGHAGKYVDVQIAPSADARCPDVDGDLVFLFTESGPDMTDSGLEQYGLWKTTKARLILLDLGGGDVLLVSLHAFDPASFEALLPEAMPIVNSITFE